MMDPNDPRYSDTPNVDTHPLEGRRPVPADPPSPLTAKVVLGLRQLAAEAKPDGMVAVDPYVLTALLDLDSARAPDAGLRAALGKRLDEIDAVVRFNASAEADKTREAIAIARAALAAPAPAGLDETAAERLAREPFPTAAEMWATRPEWRTVQEAAEAVIRLVPVSKTKPATRWQRNREERANAAIDRLRAATRPAEDGPEPGQEIVWDEPTRPAEDAEPDYPDIAAGWDGAEDTRLAEDAGEGP